MELPEKYLCYAAMGGLIDKCIYHTYDPITRHSIIWCDKGKCTEHYAICLAFQYLKIHEKDLAVYIDCYLINHPEYIPDSYMKQIAANSHIPLQHCDDIYSILINRLYYNGTTGTV